MKAHYIIIAGLLGLFVPQASLAQLAKKTKPEPQYWSTFNREVKYGDDQVIYLNAKPNDGLLWLKDTDFTNGTIDLDIKGKDTRGQSFVGIAFHGQDNETFDAVYFRPFNFNVAERKSHSVQYISMPQYDWKKLRENFPGKYENQIASPPGANDWFHAKIVVENASIKVFVNGSKDPSLEVDKISDSKSGKVGLWVGNGSDGWFKNVEIKSE